MQVPGFLAILTALLLAAPAFAQTTAAPLDLQIPPALPVPVSPPTAHHAGADPRAPGVYYGDTSGRTYVASASQAPACDDSTYNQPQVHGSVTTGVVGGSHWGGGTFGGGTVNLSKAFGSCEHPTGGVSISVGGMQNHFNGRRGR